MGKIKDFFITIRDIFSVLAIFAVIIFISTLKGCRDDENEDPPEVNPRERASSHKIFYGDSVYVTSTKIDTVYKFQIHKKQSK